MLQCNVLQDTEQGILIEGLRNRNRALEGDEVVVRLNPESEWKVREICVGLKAWYGYCLQHFNFLSRILVRLESFTVLNL
jgi:hypothetical protein